MKIRRKGIFAMAFMLLLAIAITTSTILATSTTTISIGSNSTGIGDNAIVPLMINEVTGAGSVSVNLTYDTSKVIVVNVTNSDFEFAPQDPPVHPERGYVVITAMQISSGKSGNVKIADVVIKGVNAGTSPLNLTDIELQDMSQHDIPVDGVINGTFTVQEDNTPPIVKPESVIIPEDTDYDPLWGEMSTVDATDDGYISTVRVDLSAMGGSAITNVSNAGNHSDGTFWCVFNVTNASIGTANWNETSDAYEPYYLEVNATDIYGNSNTSVSIELTVMKNGDVNNDGEVNFMGDAVYLIRHTRDVEGYGEIIPQIADVNGDGEVNFMGDAVYLIRNTRDVEGYGMLK